MRLRLHYKAARVGGVRAKKGTLVMDSVETEFRNVEEKLDLLLASEKRALCSAGFVVEDNSSRTYHYKNSHLIWIHSFRKEWLVDIERACVSVTLSYSEPI